MLFQTTEELKQFLPVTESFGFDDLSRFIEVAEREDIIIYLSQEEYDTLHTAYHNSDISQPPDTDLLKLVRIPLANMAMFKFIPFGNVNIGKAGFTVTETTSEKIASNARTEDLKDACLEAYHQGIEQLLLFLEANTAIYTDWASSDAATEYKSCFINTAIEFHKWFAINKSRRIFVSVKAIMQRVELMHIKSITGEDLYDEIKTQIEDDNISAANQLLLDIIRPAVANLTIASATVELPLLFSRQGIGTIGTYASAEGGISRNPGTAQQLSALGSHAEAQGKNFLRQLEKFLYANHGDYPLYEADDTVYVEPAPPAPASDTISNFFG